MEWWAPFLLRFCPILPQCEVCRGRDGKYIYALHVTHIVKHMDDCCNICCSMLAHKYIHVVFLCVATF